MQIWKPLLTQTHNNLNTKGIFSLEVLFAQSSGCHTFTENFTTLYFATVFKIPLKLF